MSLQYSKPSPATSEPAKIIKTKVKNRRTAFDTLNQLRSEGDINLSSARTSWNESICHRQTRDLLEQDETYFLHQSLSTPCLDVIEATKGSSLTNLQGNYYLDFHGNSVHQVGYGHPAVLNAVREQLDSLPFCPRRFTNEPAIKLAKRLIDLTPESLTRVLFAPGGTSAVGIALKISRSVTGRFKTISMWDSFHGASLDAISLGGEAIFRKNVGPLLPGTEHVPPPNPASCPFKCGNTCSLQCADYIDYVLEKEGDVAAVVSETVSSVPCFPPEDYWKQVREICDHHGTLLILDEIPHSLGRTGKMFTFEHYDIVPDILVLGKGLGGGVFPLAAVVAKEEFNVAKEGALGHYTHEKSPVACAAGNATLEILLSERLPERAETLGNLTLNKLQDELQTNPLIHEIRGLGLLLGIELSKDQCDHNSVADKIMYECLRMGLSFKVSMGNVLTLAPPLNISEEDMNEAQEILVRVISQFSEDG